MDIRKCISRTAMLAAIILGLCAIGQAQTCTSGILTSSETDGLAGTAVGPGIGAISGSGQGFYAGNGPTYKPGYVFAAQSMSGATIAINVEVTSVDLDGLGGNYSVAMQTAGGSAFAISFQRVSGSVYLSVAKTELISGQYVHTLIVPQGSPVTLPILASVNRQGGVYSAYTAPPGAGWTQVGGNVAMANDTDPVLVGLEADGANVIVGQMGSGTVNSISVFTIDGQGHWLQVPTQLTFLQVGNGTGGFSPVVQAGNLLIGPINISATITDNNQCGPTPIAQIVNNLKLLNSSGGVLWSSGFINASPQIPCAGGCSLTGVNNGSGLVSIPLVHGQTYTFQSITQINVGTAGCGSGCLSFINLTKTIPLNP